jgi:proteic killer suppression protein
MRLAGFQHKGLRRFYADGEAKGVSASLADKLRKLLFALETAQTLEQVGRFPGWKLHPLRGDLKGFWSLTVSGNWRIVFRYDEAENSASDIDLVDYH